MAEGPREIRPLGGRVFIEYMDKDEIEKTKGGLLVQRYQGDFPNYGRVVAVGPGDLQEDGTRRPPPCDVGDVVLYTKYSGAAVEVDGRELRVLMSSAIIAVVDGDDIPEALSEEGEA